MPRIALLALLAACSSSGPHAPPPPPTTSLPAQPQAPAMEPGMACAADGTCAAPFECVKYYGIAGAKGGQLSSCEIRCDAETTSCPVGTTCNTIADGPGRVCRK